MNENQIALGSRVYQISDGSWREIPEPSGEGFGSWGTVYVDNEEVVSWIKEGLKDRTVLRFRLDALPLHPPDP